MGSMFRSLRVRNYRLFFFGQLVSLTGSWMQTVALAWLVLELTNSGVALGMVTAMQFLPMLLAGLSGGLIADRFDKRHILLVTQGAMAAVAIFLTIATWTGVVRMWMIYPVALLSGLLSTIDNPTNQAFIVELVGRRDIGNAIGLGSAAVQASRAVGPAIAGVLIASMGTEICFFIDALSYIAAIVSLVAMRTGELQRSQRLHSMKGRTLEVVAYVWASAVLRSTTLIMAIVGMLAFQQTVVLPLIARNTFGGNAETYGLLAAAVGLGSLAGALVAASRLEPTGTMLVRSGMMFGAVTVVAASAPSLVSMLAVLVLVGGTGVTFVATAKALMQLQSNSLIQGRVMALFVLAFLGTTPVGGPFVGLVSEHVGPRVGLGLGGVATLGAIMVFGRPLRNVGRLPVRDDA